MLELPVNVSIVDLLLSTTYILYFHYADFLVILTVVCNNGDIRLQGGSNAREGRVEICNRQAWGTVCDDLWGNVDAGVACTQLGYTSVGQYI